MYENRNDFSFYKSAIFVQAAYYIEAIIAFTYA